MTVFLVQILPPMLARAARKCFALFAFFGSICKIYFSFKP